MKRFLHWSAALAVCLVVAEAVSRLDDWIFQGVPFLASPDRERDLTLHDELGVRGRPNGHFKKYKLNEFGFRGPPISKEKPNGVLRIMVIGASETFGLYESEGNEFPAWLAKILQPSSVEVADAKAVGKPPPPKIEVINAAVAGMALPTLTQYYEKWASQFHPDIVVIYPSPQFYLDNEVPIPAKPPTTPPADIVRSRFLERLKDTAKQSDLIKAARVWWILNRERSLKSDDWFFRTVPQDRVDAFTKDLIKLLAAVAQSGATPVLVTHGFKTPREPEEQTDQDLRELSAYRIFFPRAEPGVLPRFDHAANFAMIEYATPRLNGDADWDWSGIPLIDAAKELDGQRELFADPTHFNDEGSKKLAGIVAEGLRPYIELYQRKLEGKR